MIPHRQRDTHPVWGFHVGMDGWKGAHLKFNIPRDFLIHQTLNSHVTPHQRNASWCCCTRASWESVRWLEGRLKNRKNVIELIRPLRCLRAANWIDSPPPQTERDSLCGSLNEGNRGGGNWRIAPTPAPCHSWMPSIGSTYRFQGTIKIELVQGSLIFTSSVGRKRKWGEGGDWDV